MCDCPEEPKEYQVGTGSESFWTRPTNRYPGCICPPWRYNPAHPKPTDPNCPKHGETHVQSNISTATT
jgi:hypothetical protein